LNLLKRKAFLRKQLDRNPASCRMRPTDAGWSSLVARRAHNPKVVGSNPAPATKYERPLRNEWPFLLLCPPSSNPLFATPSLLRKGFHGHGPLPTNPFWLEPGYTLVSARLCQKSFEYYQAASNLLCRLKLCTFESTEQE